MTFEEALTWVEFTLETKTGKQLTLPEKQILKAAWLNETYSAVAESLYMSVGHIKDLAYSLWKRLSDILNVKITKNNLRHLLLERRSTAPTQNSSQIEDSETDHIESSKGTILIIDDLIENLNILTKIFTKKGYEVRSFTNGKNALQTVHLYPPPT